MNISKEPPTAGATHVDVVQQSGTLVEPLQLLFAAVGRKVDLDDLIDTGDVAELLKLASRNVVGVYRGRYPDFPAPVFERGACRLWLRADVEAWARATGRSRSSS